MTSQRPDDDRLPRPKGYVFQVANTPSPVTPRTSTDSVDVPHISCLGFARSVDRLPRTTMTKSSSNSMGNCQAQTSSTPPNSSSNQDSGPSSLPSHANSPSSFSEQHNYPTKPWTTNQAAQPHASTLKGVISLPSKFRFHSSNNDRPRNVLRKKGLTAYHNNQSGFQNESFGSEKTGSGVPTTNSDGVVVNDPQRNAHGHQRTVNELHSSPVLKHELHNVTARNITSHGPEQRASLRLVTDDTEASPLLPEPLIASASKASSRYSEPPTYNHGIQDEILDTTSHDPKERASLRTVTVDTEDLPPLPEPRIASASRASSRYSELPKHDHELQDEMLNPTIHGFKEPEGLRMVTVNTKNFPLPPEPFVASASDASSRYSRCSGINNYESSGEVAKDPTAHDPDERASLRTITVYMEELPVPSAPLIASASDSSSGHSDSAGTWSELSTSTPVPMSSPKVDNTTKGSQGLGQQISSQTTLPVCSSSHPTARKSHDMQEGRDPLVPVSEGEHKKHSGSAELQREPDTFKHPPSPKSTVEQSSPKEAELCTRALREQEEIEKRLFDPFGKEASEDKSLAKTPPRLSRQDVHQLETHRTPVIQSNLTSLETTGHKRRKSTKKPRTDGKSRSIQSRKSTVSARSISQRRKSKSPSRIVTPLGPSSDAMPSHETEPEKGRDSKDSKTKRLSLFTRRSRSSVRGAMSNKNEKPSIGSGRSRSVSIGKNGNRSRSKFGSDDSRRHPDPVVRDAGGKEGTGFAQMQNTSSPSLALSSDPEGRQKFQKRVEDCSKELLTLFGETPDDKRQVKGGSNQASATRTPNSLFAKQTAKEARINDLDMEAIRSHLLSKSYNLKNVSLPYMNPTRCDPFTLDKMNRSLPERMHLSTQNRKHNSCEKSHDTGCKEPSLPVPPPRVVGFRATVSPAPEDKHDARHALADGESNMLEDNPHVKAASSPEVNKIGRLTQDPAQSMPEDVRKSVTSPSSGFECSERDHPSPEAHSIKSAEVSSDHSNRPEKSQRQSRLRPVGRIPQVVPRREREYKPSSQSFSRPFGTVDASWLIALDADRPRPPRRHTVHPSSVGSKSTKNRFSGFIAVIPQPGSEPKAIPKPTNDAVCEENDDLVKHPSSDTSRSPGGNGPHEEKMVNTVNESLRSRLNTKPDARGDSTPDRNVAQFGNTSPSVRLEQQSSPKLSTNELLRASSQRKAPPLNATSRGRENVYAQTNIRSGSLMTSRWLSYGRVLFSPAHKHVTSEKRERILIIDGLGNDDWSSYCALAYPSAEVFNLNVDTRYMSHPRDPPSWQLLSNHRTICHPCLERQFAFPTGYFAAVVLRFPASCTVTAQNNVVSECKRVLRSGGYLEMCLLDLEMTKMGIRTKKAVRKLKEKTYMANANISLKPVSDNIQQLLGTYGFDNLQRCTARLPVAGSIASSSSSCSFPSQSSHDNHGGSLGEPLSNSCRSPSPLDNEVMAKTVSKVGRWWYSQCYEIPIFHPPPPLSLCGPQGNSNNSGRCDYSSIWSDRKLLRECQQQGTGFRLLLAYAQKPIEVYQRSASV